MKNRNYYISFLLTLSLCTGTLSGCTKASLKNPDDLSNAQEESVSLFVAPSDTSDQTMTPTDSTVSHITLQPSSLDPNTEIYDEKTRQMISYASLIEYIQSQPADTVDLDLHQYQLTIPQQLDLLKISSDTGLNYLWNVNVDGVIIDNQAEEANISEHNIAEQTEYTAEDIFTLLPRLKRIDMCNCGYSNDAMAALCDKYQDIRIIWEIHLSHWNIRTDVVAFSSMKTCSDDFYMYSEDAKYFKYCTDLVALDLGHNHVYDISFLQYLPKLRILILVDNSKNYTDNPIQYVDDLSVLKYTPELRYLEFFVGSVRDLSFLQYTPNIVDLNISYNPVSDASALYNLPHLERLFLEHTAIPYSEYEKLKAAYPNAQIEYYGEGSIDHGWREHPRYFAMRDMFEHNYVHELFMK